MVYLYGPDHCIYCRSQTGDEYILVGCPTPSCDYKTMVLERDPDPDHCPRCEPRAYWFDGKLVEPPNQSRSTHGLSVDAQTWSAHVEASPRPAAAHDRDEEGRTA